MATQSTGALDADLGARADAATLLARYPQLTEGELGQLQHWFKRVAGPLDVGLLASDPAIAEQYQAYRKAHHDRFTVKDIAIGALFVAIIACVGAIFLMMVP